MIRLAAALCLLVGPTIARADFVLSHSGYLLDAVDHPITAPAQALTFRLVDAASGTGSVAWEATCPVAVRDGYYAVTLGDGCGTALTLVELPAGATRWLEVSVGSQALTPRARLGGVPSAGVAEFASNAGQLGGHAPEWYAPATHGHAASELTGLLPPAKGGSGTANAGLLAWGSHDVSLSTTGTTSLALPTAGTLATLAGTETLTNKTISGGTITGVTLSSKGINDGATATAITVAADGKVGLGSTAPSSSLDVQGSFATATVTITASLTLGTGHHVVLANSASPITVTLPSAVGSVGREYVVKNVNTGKVTLATTSGQAIDDVTSYPLALKWEHLHVVSNGTGWTIVDGGTYPRVHAKRSGSGMPNAGPGNPFVLNDTLEDTHGAWDTSDGSFVAPVSGVYTVTMMLHDGGASSQNCPRAYVNGSATSHRAFQVIAPAHVQGAETLRLNAGDRLRYHNDCGGTFVSHTDTSGQFVWIVVQRVH